MPPSSGTYLSVVSVINEVLAAHGISQAITSEDITITERTISDGMKKDQVLSNAIVERFWPSVSQADVFHFTSLEAADSILGSNTFRLTNIEKRQGEGEVRTFCESHQLTGYLERDTSGEPLYRRLIMPNTFYASFTSTSLDDDEQRYFWQTFASDSGVRFRFRVKASNPDFRRVRYEAKKGQPIPLIAQLSTKLRNEFGREFVLSGISRVCSFYLAGADYGREQECRMLCRVWDQGPQAVGSGPNSYIEMPLGAVSKCGYELHITEVCSDSRPNMPSNVAFVRRNS